MKVLNLGSLNIDKVYSVDHFVASGETILSQGKLGVHCGGKGLNQSVAAARAGAAVWHAGAVGADGNLLIEKLQAAGVHLEHLQQLDTVSGHAVIQLNPKGQNCIIVCAGANGEVTQSYIDKVLSYFEAGDILLLQNETSEVAYAIEAGHKKRLKIAFNASPITDTMLSYPLEMVDWLLVNEVEGAALAGKSDADKDILQMLAEKYPHAAIVLTVGKRGVIYRCGSEILTHGIYEMPVVDTTAAGDTFSGFFVASIVKGLSPAQALHMASLASSIAVGRAGAAASIPTWDEAVAFETTALPLG